MLYSYIYLDSFFMYIYVKCLQMLYMIRIHSNECIDRQLTNRIQYISSGRWMDVVRTREYANVNISRLASKYSRRICQHGIINRATYTLYSIHMSLCIQFQVYTANLVTALLKKLLGF